MLDNKTTVDETFLHFNQNRLGYFTRTLKNKRLSPADEKLKVKLEIKTNKNR